MKDLVTILTNILTSDIANKFVVSIGISACARYFFSVNSWWLLLIVFCVSWVAYASIRWIISAIAIKVQNKRDKQYKQQEKEQYDLLLASIIKDCYEQLSDFKRDVLFYAVMAGKRSNAYRNVFIYPNDPYAYNIQNIDGLEVEDDKHRTLPITQIKNHNGELSFWLHAALLDCVENDVRAHNIQLKDIEDKMKIIRLR